MVVKRLWLAGMWWLMIGCGNDELAPIVPPCTADDFPVTLPAPGDYLAVDAGAVAGCVVFPAAPAGAPAEYLVVAQSASVRPNDAQVFRLAGAAVGATALAPPPSRLQAAVTGPAPVAWFDGHLRRLERTLAVAAPRGAAAGGQVRARLQATPVDSGSVRSFSVCLVLLECDPRKLLCRRIAGHFRCSSTVGTVTATAQKVGQHIAIYIDNDNQMGGFTQGDLDALRAVFDTLLYEVDTLAFGRESDIDDNGMVVILMTGKVNQLIPKPDCVTQGSVIGYFFGADLVPKSSGGTGNNGEIFYSQVADPSGALGCAVTPSQAKVRVPRTFAHEFQHLISFNQHYLLRGGFPEDLWLNEALSHYAEERAGRMFLPGDTTTFCMYVSDNLSNARSYFEAPGDHFLVDTASIGGLPERGAYWLFVRYLVDQFGGTSFAAADAFTRKLVGTSAQGAANVAQQTGMAFATVIERWGLANWVSDLPGFPAPAELQYTSWAFRTAYPTLATRCPNVPAAFALVPEFGDGGTIDLTGTLRAGSGSYVRARQAAGAPAFTLEFTSIHVPGDLIGVALGRPRALRASLAAQLTVIRIQ